MNIMDRTLYALCLVILTAVPSALAGTIKNPPYIVHNCAPASASVGGACQQEGPSQSLSLYNNPTLGGTNNDVLLSGFSSSYVPFSGAWKMRLHYCLRTTRGACTIGASSFTVDSRLAVYLNNTMPIADQNPNFGGGATTITNPGSGNFCLTFVSADGTEYTTASDLSCRGGPELRARPSTCDFNAGAAIDVNMGTLERGEIATMPGSSAYVPKTINVVCKRHSTLSVEMKIQYTAIAVSGYDVVKTSTTGLGIAVLYNGRVMTPSDTVELDYRTGTTPLSLGFEAVRDPSLEVKEIKTGSFTASAVLIFTQL